MAGEKAKVRVFMFEMEGGDKAVESALHNLASVIVRSPQPRMLPAPAANNGKDKAIPESVLPFEEDLDPPADPVSKPKRVPKAQPLRVLSDVDLKSGDAPWEAYAKAKNPDSDLMKFLVVAAWFKQYRALDAITSNHVYTCFKAVGWTARRNMTQQFLDLKRKRGLMDNGTAHGTWAINHLGEDRVDKMGTVV